VVLLAVVAAVGLAPSRAGLVGAGLVGAVAALGRLSHSNS
jgi:hypothetical protein